MADLAARVGDRVLRALTNDNAFRVIAARTTQTVRGVIAAQNVQGAVAGLLGDLVTGTILVRETMAPGLRVQGLLRGVAGRGSLVADSNPDGTTRGLVSVPGDTSFELGDGATLQLMRTLPNGALHQGVVEAPAPGGISAALMAYMQLSEQVVSVISVGAIAGDGGPSLAGGYIVQLLPEADRDAIARMIDRLGTLATTDVLLETTGGDPTQMILALVGDQGFAPLEESSLSFACQCSDVRLLSTLATLPRNDIEELMRGGEVLDTACDFCGKQYRIHPEQLRGLLDRS